MQTPIVVLAGAVMVLVGVALSANRGSTNSIPGAISQDQPKKIMDRNDTSPQREDKVVKSDEEWKKLLTEEQFEVLRGHGTERPFSCSLLENKGEGFYHCVGCDLPLFRSGGKFNSGTGWPSYTEPASDDSVWYRRDSSFGMTRVEVLCSRCDGHLGHVFDDGPPPTGLRYCINGVCLKFVPKQ